MPAEEEIDKLNCIVARVQQLGIHAEFSTMVTVAPAGEERATLSDRGHQWTGPAKVALARLSDWTAIPATLTSGLPWPSTMAIVDEAERDRRLEIYFRECDQLRGPVGITPAWGAGGGWLSPEGKFWPCPDLVHGVEADRIVAELGISIIQYGGSGTLESLGWVHVKDDGDILTSRPFTQAQMDVLADLAASAASMRTKLMRAIAARQEEMGSEFHR